MHLSPFVFFFLLEKEDNHENNFNISKNIIKFRKTRQFSPKL